MVRNLFGALFVSILLGGSALAAYKATDQAVQLLVVFLGVQLALSVFARADYLFSTTFEYATGTMPSDVAEIAAALFLPYWFWGFAFGAISVAAVAYGIKVLWR